MRKKGKKIWTHKVTKVEKNTRISDYAGTAFPILGSKSATKKAIADGRLTINRKKASTGDYVKPGDVIALIGSGIKQVKKFDMELPVVYQDDFLIIVNKPGGIAVNGNRYKTVENVLANTNRQNKQADALPRPVAVHRIDLPTCGLVLLAKTKTALIKLGKAFQQNKVDKTYVAVAHGEAPKNGTIDLQIDDKKALTKYETVQVVPSRLYHHFSLIRLKPITGRTHQLRKHLKSIGHPIVGDKLYAEPIRTIQGKGLLLCACKMSFEHPISGQPVLAEIDTPNKFSKLLQREAERF